MSMKKKLIAGGLAVCMVATLATGITLAYFTDDEYKTNTFTAVAGPAGEDALGITLTETSEESTVTDTQTGKQVTLHPGTPKEKQLGFDYEEVLPGVAYAKEPVITLDKDDETGYKSLPVHLYVELTISNISTLEEAVAGVEGIVGTEWEKSFLVNPDPSITLDKIVARKTAGDTYSMVFYCGVLDHDATTAAPDQIKLFDGVKIPAAMTQENMTILSGHPVDLTIHAYGIQYAGLEDELVANAAAQTEWFSAENGYEFVASKLPA